MVIKNKLFLFGAIIFFSTVVSIACYAQNGGFYIGDGFEYLPVPYKYSVSFDKKMSQRAGADLSFSVLELYRVFENKLFFPSADGALKRVCQFILRLLVAGESLIIQHEAFGHGSRMRELGVEVKEYGIGLLHGYVSFEFPLDFNEQKKAVIAVGGVEGTHILAERIKNRFFEDAGVILPVHGAGYLFNQLDKFLYSLNEFKEGIGHDLKMYLDAVNKVYGTEVLTRRQIKAFAMIDLVDPFLYFSLYSFFGDEDFRIPMFKIKGIKYLPALRSIFTPYGIETKLLNHFVLEESGVYGQLNFIYGDNEYQKSYSIEANLYNIIKFGKMNFGVECSLWRQPDLFTNSPIKAENRWGTMVNLISGYSFADSIKVFAELGYKSKGYKSGFPVDSTPLVRVGISLAI